MIACLVGYPGNFQNVWNKGARAQSSSAEVQTRPNILFVFTDDHAPQAIGAYGGRLSEIAPTPNIDQLAADGMLFHNAFVTNSICAPSRAVVLTGKHSHRNGVRTNSDEFDGSQQIFPRLLQEAGYQTAIIGKWHLKSDPTGFDYWEVLYPSHGSYYNSDFRTADDTIRRTGHVTEVITDRTLEWLKEAREPDRPFMLMYQDKAPHRNWQPAADYLTMYDDEQIPAPKTLFYDYAGLSIGPVMQEMEVANDLRWGWDLKLPTVPGHPGDSTAGYQRFIQRFTSEQRRTWETAYGPKNERFYEQYASGELQERDLVRWKYQRYLKDYLRSVAAIDDNLGRVLDYLEEAGLADNTIVIYSSDQGFFLGENGWFDKRWMYEESLKMPLIVRWPGVVEPRSETRALVQNLDFAETFLDIAGVEVSSEMQGRSLVPLFKSERPSEWREAIYYHYYQGGGHGVPRHEGVRTERYKLIRYYTLNQWELFDLEKDPDELQSVYGRSAYADVKKELEDRLRKLHSKYEVPEEDWAPGSK